jgi:hypothetical protein
LSGTPQSIVIQLLEGLCLKMLIPDDLCAEAEKFVRFAAEQVRRSHNCL